MFHRRDAYAVRMQIAVSPRPKLPTLKEIPPYWLEAALHDSGVRPGMLAKRLGVDAVTVSRWKNDRQTITRARWLEILAALPELGDTWDPPAVPPASLARPGPVVLRSIPVDERSRGGRRSTLELYTLSAAAGHFGTGEAVEPEAILEVDGVPGITEKHFVARARGHSMEPLISDGALCIFRATDGLPHGEIVLVQYQGPADPDTGGSYTVKRLSVVDRPHTATLGRKRTITLEPLNPAHQPIVIDEARDDDVKVLAVFVTTLDEGEPQA